MSGESRPRVAASLILAASVLTLRPVAAVVTTGPARVIGGTPVNDNGYAFMASLQNGSGGGGGRHFCGGTLVDPEWVLTAAHCVDGRKPSEFRVVVGAVRLSAGAAVHQPVEVRVHPAYDGDATHGADVAMVRLSAPVAGVAPLAAVGSAERQHWEAGDPAEVVGWGVTSESGSEASDRLQTAIVHVQPDADMAAATAYGEMFLASDMLGAGRLAGGFDACRGDSGGPLLVRVGKSDVRQVGIVSFGLGCGRPGYPGVYSRLGEGRVRTFVDSLIALRVPPVREREGGVARFMLTLARPSTVAASVAWETVGQTAREGSDFTGGRGVVEFRPGQTTAAIDVALTADTKAEGDETFRLQLSRPVNVWLAADRVGATVISDS